MNKYEIALILSAGIEDEERGSIVEKVKGFVERFNGKVTTVDEWGKKLLAYEIQKQNEAFYYFVHFETEDAECPNELEKQLRIMDNVFRYLIVKEDEE